MPDRPNILWIQTDEQRPDSLSCYGSEWARTPALQKLAERGVVMGNAFCQSPVCAPSRESQLAGRYPHELGSLNNRSVDLPFPPGTITFPEIFEEAGYETVSFGKRHTPEHRVWKIEDQERIYFPEHTGFCGLHDDYDEDAHHVIKRPGGKLILAGTYPEPETNPSRHITDQAIDFLKKRPASRPFLLRVSHLWPHTPVLPPAPYDRLYDPGELPVRMYNERGRQERAHYDRMIAERDGMDHLNEAHYRQIWKDYMGLCAYVDHEVGRLLDVLDELGLTGDTIVVFSTDHGKLLGEWGTGEKDVFDDPVWRVPFIWSWPGHLPEGTVREDLTELVDTGRTLLSLAGLERRIPAHYRGRNLFGDPAPDAVFVTIRAVWYYPEESRKMRCAVRTRDYRMDVTLPIDGTKPDKAQADGNLFCLKTDPYEVHNLWNDPAEAERIDALLDRMQDWLSIVTPDPRLLDPSLADILY